MIVALLLHALLPPTIKHVVKRDNKKLIVKSTIKDSQDSFFIHVTVNNDFDRKINAQRSLLLNRDETLQPLIIGIGNDLLSITEFIVFYDNVKYTFNNFIAALDCCFKIFHALDLHYPKDSNCFWLFIETFLFEMKCDENLTPSILCLIQDLS